MTPNPIYLGNSLLIFGIGMVTANPWYFVSASIVAILVDRLAIRCEEQHLSVKFGQAWADYVKATPRWIGW